MWKNGWILRWSIKILISQSKNHVKWRVSSWYVANLGLRKFYFIDRNRFRNQKSARGDRSRLNSGCPLPFAIARYIWGLPEMWLRYLWRPWTSDLKMNHNMLRIVSYLLDKIIRFGQNSAHFHARKFAPPVSSKIKNLIISSPGL